MNFTHRANPVAVTANVILGINPITEGVMLALDDTRQYFAGHEMLARYTPTIGDYLVTQDDGYQYVNPKAVFERKYAAITPADSANPPPVSGLEMCFSGALLHLKGGARIARAGWNGKGMWVAMGSAHPGLPAVSFWNEHARQHAVDQGGTCPVQAYILMKTAQGDIQMGWAPTMSDVLAEDWLVLE
jgi:hypothetical protein